MCRIVMLSWLGGRPCPGGLGLSVWVVGREACTALSWEPASCSLWTEPVCFHLNNSKASDPILFVTKALFTPLCWRDVRNKGLSGCSRQHWGVPNLGLCGEQAGLGTPLGREVVWWWLHACFRVLPDCRWPSCTFCSPCQLSASEGWALLEGRAIWGAAGRGCVVCWPPRPMEGPALTSVSQPPSLCPWSLQSQCWACGREELRPHLSPGWRLELSLAGTQP